MIYTPVTSRPCLLFMSALLLFFVAFLIKIMTFFPLCNNLDQLYMVVRYVHCTYEISKVSYKIEKTPKVWDWAYTPRFNNILYKHIAAHFLLHKLILFSQKKECTVHSQFPKLYQMISKYKSRTINYQGNLAINHTHILYCNVFLIILKFCASKYLHCTSFLVIKQFEWIWTEDWNSIN